MNKDIKVKAEFTLPLCFDVPNKNGTVFTRDAIANALAGLREPLPLVAHSEHGKQRIVGYMNNVSSAVWDYEAGICYATIDGNLMIPGDMLYSPDEVDEENRTVTKFTVKSFDIVLEK